MLSRSKPTQARHMALIAWRGLAEPENDSLSVFLADSGASEIRLAMTAARRCSARGPAVGFPLSESGSALPGAGVSAPAPFNSRGVFMARPHAAFRLSSSTRARMSSARHAVVRGPSLTGAGYFPVRTPAHQLDRPIGKKDRTWGSRRKPVSGRTGLSCCIECPLWKSTASYSRLEASSVVQCSQNSEDRSDRISTGYVQRLSLTSEPPSRDAARFWDRQFRRPDLPGQ